MSFASSLEEEERVEGDMTPSSSLMIVIGVLVLIVSLREKEVALRFFSFVCSMQIETSHFYLNSIL